jgi:hypothetical protein
MFLFEYCYLYDIKKYFVYKIAYFDGFPMLNLH